MRQWAKGLICLLTAGGVVLHAQRQAQPLRSRTDLVSVFATVTDCNGALVPDLQQSDFAVSDDGKRQSIALFSADVQPVTVVVMLDRSGSLADESELVRDAAAEFVTRLLPADRARIGNFADEIRLSPDRFTGDRSVLLDVLKSDLQNGGPSPIWTAVDRSITALVPESGRRVVLLVSDGRDAPARGQVKTDVKDLMYRAQYDEIMVYSIGVPTAEPGETANKPEPDLKHLADESGGAYVELDSTRSVTTIFTRIADELHRQYWIGFTPSKLDGKVHRLEIKLLRPGLTARARRSYIADSRR